MNIYKVYFFKIKNIYHRYRNRIQKKKKRKEKST